MVSGSDEPEVARVRKRRRRSHRRWWKRLANGERQLQLVLFAAFLVLSVIAGLAVASQCSSDNAKVQGRPSPAIAGVHTARAFLVFPATVTTVYAPLPR